MRRRSLFLVACIVAMLSMTSLFGGDFTVFSAHDLSGRVVDQSVFADKKLTMVTVWATYCGYCREEMPSIAELQEEYPDMQVVGIVTDILSRNGKLLMGQVALAEKILKQTGLVETTFLPETSIMRAIGNIQGVPTKFYVDRSGNVVLGPIVGYQSKDEIQRDIVSLLGGR